jgi:hypothetical protein
VSRWSFTKNHYMMHSQQNVKCSPINFSISVVLSVHPCSRKSLRTAKEIFIKCDVRVFSLKICHAGLGYQITIMDTLCEDLHVFLAAMLMSLAKKTLF